MKFVKKLSERGVELYNSNNKLIVKKFLIKKQIEKILEFNKDSNFDYKPKIIDIDKKKQFIIEEFLNGKTLININYHENKKIIISLLELSKKNVGNINFKEYLDKNYNNKINSLILGENEKKEIDNIFKEIKRANLNKTLNLNYTHGDLKGDNIIYKDGNAFFIDWEWLKKGHYVEDVQKFIQTTLNYDKLKTDDFLNNFYKYRNIDWKLFIFLEMFHYFLNQILQLSKKRISIDDFKKSIENKLNLMINNNIY